jgi:hypothetical protein
MPIDSIVPGTTSGTAAATSVNAVIDHVNAASAWPDPGTPVMRTPTQENFTGGRVKVATATDPEDAIPLNQFTVLLPAALKTAQAAGTPSIRAIGTTATTAAAGNHSHGAATGTTAGFMSAADKAKLEGLLPFKLAAAKPETPTSPGAQWEVFIDGEEFFLCVAPNVWRMWTLMSWGE